MKKDLNVRSETSCVTNPIQLPLTSASGSAENHGCTCAERPFLFCPGTESSPHVDVGGEPPIPTLSVRMASHLKQSGTRAESRAFRIGRTGQRVNTGRDTAAFHHPRLHLSPHASVDAAALHAASVVRPEAVKAFANFAERCEPSRVEPLVERWSEVVVPPTRNARISKKKTKAARTRNRAMKVLREPGRREREKRSGDHQQERVENAFCRYKSIIRGGLRSRRTATQATEVGLATDVLNRMLELGAARSEAVGD